MEMRSRRQGNTLKLVCNENGKYSEYNVDVICHRIHYRISKTRGNKEYIQCCCSKVYGEIKLLSSSPPPSIYVR